MSQFSYRRSFTLLAVLLSLGTFLAFAAGFSPSAPPERKFTAEELAFYDKEVEPILDKYCFRCHGKEKVKGGFRLNTREGIFKGGDTGPAVKLDKPEESLLLQAIQYKEGLEMPPNAKLPAKEIETLTRWVKAGVPMKSGGTPLAADKHEPEGGKVTPESRNYWAYRALARPAVPEVKDKARVANPIDAFLLARLEPKGLTLSAPADRTALIRRVTYDLIGLPPTPEEIDAFVKDSSPNAYEKLVDRLLASPQYGEKWGRHWLDLVRYAETHGYERDSAKPFAWRYRDYVINSFNKDKPYDVFLTEQLAGDELDKVTPETLTATGYYRLGVWDDEPADRAQLRYDVLDGIVSTTSQVFLGMTVGCARCHDHKKDPIPQRDYYKLLAFFNDVTDMNVKNTRRMATDEDRVAYQRQTKAKREEEGKLYQQIYQLEQQFALALAEKKPGEAPLQAASDIVDLTYRFYRDTWDKLPDFDATKVETEGRVASNLFSLAPASRSEAMGLVFEGKLKVPEQGEYTFSVDSTAGARLLIDGKVFIDQPLKGRHSDQAKATLEAGPRAIRLEYFNAYEQPSLKVAWSGPGVPRRLLSEGPASGERVILADSRTKPQMWSYTTVAPSDGWNQPAFDVSGWTKGQGGFGTRGTPGAIVRTRWDSKDIWMRKTFAVEELPESLALDLHHDDDVEVFLNGQPIYKASGFLVKYARLPLRADALKAVKKGENLIAVHCHQQAGGQYVDVGLVETRDKVDLTDLIKQHGTEILGKEAADRYVALSTQLEASRKAVVEEPGYEIMSVEERGRKPTTILIRGNPNSPGEKVEAGFPEVLVSTAVKIAERDANAPSAGKRLALAKWLTDPKNPVPARVMANRLWQYHFGRGLVPSSNDFGKLGEGVTHPELLDWLASEFMAGDWKIKRMHKLLMMSNAYQMTAAANGKGMQVDPANNLWWRFNMRRLSAEEVRDSILAVTGKLNLKAGGPPVYPFIPREVLAGQSVPGQGWGRSTPDEASRRSVYVHVKRSLLVPILATHDQADTDSSCAVRFTTTVPTQSLGMLNGEFTNEQAGYLVERIQREVPNDLNGQVRRVLRLVAGRVPTAEEIKKDVAFIKGLQTNAKLTADEALKRYCLLAINLNEFVYLD